MKYIEITTLNDGVLLIPVKEISLVSTGKKRIEGGDFPEECGCIIHFKESIEAATGIMLINALAKDSYDSVKKQLDNFQ